MIKHFCNTTTKFFPQNLYGPIACLERSFVIIIRMRTYMIVMHIRKVFYSCVKLLLSMVIMLIYQIILQSIEISFHWSIIVWIPSFTHALCNSKGFAKLGEFFGCVLASFGRNVPVNYLNLSQAGNQSLSEVCVWLDLQLYVDL